ncbi:MAG: hypothetical protein JXB18_07295 [Sedimentisphaerales bacterium]|nr:hypothetical protein [Sedimentisphaerales bacterium]
MCSRCWAAYMRRYRQRKAESQAGQPEQPEDSPHLSALIARYSAEIRTLEAAGYHPDRITAAQAEQVLSRHH